MFVAERGDYGEGNLQELSDTRIELLYGGDAHRNELTIGGETTYDVLVQPTDDGGVVITYTDITERKKSENRFRALLESAPDAMVIVDATGTIIQSNRRTEELFGYSSDEFALQKG